MRLARNVGPPISPTFVPRIIEGLRSVGVDTDAVLGPFGLKTADVTTFDQPICLSVLYDLWQSAVDVSGESGLGVRLAARIRPENYELFGFVLSNSASLGDALLRAMRMFRLVSNFSELSFAVEGHRATLALKALYPELLHRESIEFMLAGAGTIARHITGQHLVPLEVRFAHPAPADTRHHEAHFLAPIHFGRPHNACVFESSVLHAPIVGSDSRLLAKLDREAQDMLKALPRTGNLSRRVLELIHAELRDGNPSADTVAEKLGLHPRTLGRRLKAEGASHQQLLDQLRYQLAERYLREPGLSINEVAFLLGYSDTSALNKAFKRWTGTSPTQYREREAP